MKRLLSFCILMPLACSAGVIYNNGLPNQASADSISDTLVAEDVPVAAAATLTSFEFWDVEGSGAYNGSISWLLYSNASGLPGSILAQGSASGASITRTSTGNSAFGFNEFDNVVDATGSLTSGSLSLAIGTYWLGIHDGDLSNTTFQDFYWETTANNSTTFGVGLDLTSEGATWATTSQEHAFNVSGTPQGSSTPEPGTVAIMSLGLAGLATLRRRKA